MVMEQLSLREAPYIMIYPPWSPITQDSTLAEVIIPPDGNVTHSSELRAQTKMKMVVWAFRMKWGAYYT
jgi:hypothetical protein